MRAGELRHKIEIQTATESIDAYNAPTQTWATTYTVWAAIYPLRGQERLIAAQQEASVDFRIRIRYRSDITPANRVKFGDRFFDIDAVINADERNIFLDLMSREII